MNIIYNALSAKNVKVHGMSTSRWTTKDKITQYKGLVNLYNRDRKITDTDNVVLAKQNRKNVQLLRKTIEADRNKLDNAIRGDRQKLHNVLTDHRDLQLAHRNSDPLKVLDNVHQVNFIKRKTLDKLKYQLKLKSQELIDLKLEKTLLEDRLKYEDLGKIKEEKVAQIITGKVQDAFLKKEAALAIEQTYEQIINVMKRDTYFFDGILSAIQNDYVYQCRCILNAIVQGQLATEYKYDRESEYNILEKKVIENIKAQKEDVQIVKEQAESLQSNLKLLQRRDSDLTTCAVKIQDSQHFKTLKEDMEKINSILYNLANTSLVTSFEQIFPSIQEQTRQKKKLSKLAKKCEQNRDTLHNKLNHAELMCHVLDNTMVETTGEYTKRKKELLDLIAEEQNKKKKYDHSQLMNHNLIAQVRMGIRQIQQLCNIINMGKTEKKVIQRFEDSDELIVEPEEDETDALKIITELSPKLQLLVTNATERFNEDNLDVAYKFYEHLMREKTGQKDEETKSDKILFDDVSGSDMAHILTRADIKQISAEIVAANQHNDDFIPLVPITRKKRKF